jgi:hypothetical protein
MYVANFVPKNERDGILFFSVYLINLIFVATAIITINLGPQWASQLAVTIAYLVVIGAVVFLQEVITIIEMRNNRNSSRINIQEMQPSGMNPGSPITSSSPSFTDANRKVHILLPNFAVF